MKIKKQIVIDPGLFDEAQTFCKDNYFTFSALVSLAVAEYVRRHEYDKEKQALAFLRTAFNQARDSK